MVNDLDTQQTSHTGERSLASRGSTVGLGAGLASGLIIARSLVGGWLEYSGGYNVPPILIAGI